MNKSRKVATLEHWFGIDNILFGKNAKEVITSTELYEKYLVNKGAFLSNLYEIYDKLNYQPKREYSDINEMVKTGYKNSADALKNAKTILESSNIRKIVKQEIKETSILEDLDESDVARYVVRRRRNAVAIDAMVMEEALNDSNSKALTDWQGEILVNAHKTLRDYLIEISIQA